MLQPNIILNRSTGFVALMRFFKDVYLSFNKIGDVIYKKEFKEIFDKIELKEDDFNKDRYVPGSSGIGQLYKYFFDSKWIRINLLYIIKQNVIYRGLREICQK